MSAEEGRWFVGVSGGTNGIAPEIGYRGEHLGLRANGGFLDYSRSENIDDIDYDGKLKLNSFGLLADWYPFAGGFRISAGARSSSNKIDLHATPTANVEIGNVSYTPAQAGNLDGTVDFKKLAARVYGGDSTTRIMQEILLGVGGVRLLRTLGIEPSVFHMNEGHAAFLIL